ncbi:MAG: 2-amino-4-hydroxy-6-hydroxymethyldihydropteridine diphosphokinase [Desulfocapsaceae bacterium]|jgi:2-amino-4-hydroxy-6-hydroxymethyldihydropteridine diphosphokinase|nr:2-amino-4-hydroxy-6-hydroxymethyldihydropteridine diphosphokinase [Desulfocapsaceae bacterium]
MVDAFVGLGSNLGDSGNTVLTAWKLLGGQQGIDLVKLSRPYLSAPVGMTSDNWFTNAVGHLRTHHSAHCLLDIFLATETSLGRVRSESSSGYQDRTVDLDLLYYGALVHTDAKLSVPHPHLYERCFVLAPLASIAPDFMDPARQTSFLLLHEQLLERIHQGITANQEIEESDWDDARISR